MARDTAWFPVFLVTMPAAAQEFYLFWGGRVPNAQAGVSKGVNVRRVFNPGSTNK